MNKSYDIIIAGGGVIGSAVAYFLSQDNELSIALIDKKRVGNATRASAGGLWPIGESVGLGCGVIFFKTLSRTIAEAGGGNAPPILRPHTMPEFFFDFCLKSNAMFPGLAQEMKEKYGLDFFLEKTGLKFIMYDDNDLIYARQIADSIPRFKHHLQWLDVNELREDEPHVSRESIGALQFLHDDQLNPFMLSECYREASRQNGVDLYLETTVLDVTGSGTRVTGVTLENQTLDCSLLINAGGSWASEISCMAYGEPLPIKPVKGQIVLSETMPKILNSCLSTSDCYMAQKDNGEILIGSTTEETGFDASVTINELRGLAEGAVKCVPLLKDVNIKRTWAGIRPGTPDEIPILGPVSGVDGYMNACGHFRTGILTSAITGEILSALVHGTNPPVDLAPFLLSRFS
ncbi:MAG: FAD-dependent oxidoreductase [Gammaproteobacteria bacterium]|nr:FAD-dependent oxidoreductase [Gammaproteobacteria bacterium]